MLGCLCLNLNGLCDTLERVVRLTFKFYYDKLKSIEAVFDAH